MLLNTEKYKDDGVPIKFSDAGKTGNCKYDFVPYTYDAKLIKFSADGTQCIIKITKNLTQRETKTKIKDVNKKNKKKEAREKDRKGTQNYIYQEVKCRKKNDLIKVSDLGRLPLQQSVIDWLEDKFIEDNYRLVDERRSPGEIKEQILLAEVKKNKKKCSPRLYQFVENEDGYLEVE